MTEITKPLKTFKVKAKVSCNIAGQAHGFDEDMVRSICKATIMGELKELEYEDISVVIMDVWETQEEKS